MFTIVPATGTTQHAHLAAAPRYATIDAAFAALGDASAFVVRVPRASAKRAAIVVFQARDLALASHLAGYVTISGNDVTTCKHNNVGVPLIARADGWPHECFSCGNGMLVNVI